MASVPPPCQDYGEAIVLGKVFVGMQPGEVLRSRNHDHSYVGSAVVRSLSPGAKWSQEFSMPVPEEENKTPPCLRFSASNVSFSFPRLKLSAYSHQLLHLLFVSLLVDISPAHLLFFPR